MSSCIRLQTQNELSVVPADHQRTSKLTLLHIAKVTFALRMTISFLQTRIQLSCIVWTLFKRMLVRKIYVN